MLKRELNSHLCILLSFVVLVSGGKRGKGIYFLLAVSVFLLLRDVPLRILQELIDVLSKNLFEILHARLGALTLLLSHCAAVWVLSIVLLVINNGVVLDGLTHQTLMLGRRLLWLAKFIKSLSTRCRLYQLGQLGS